MSREEPEIPELATTKKTSKMFKMAKILIKMKFIPIKVFMDGSSDFRLFSWEVFTSVLVYVILPQALFTPVALMLLKRGIEEVHDSYWDRMKNLTLSNIDGALIMISQTQAQT